MPCSDTNKRTRQSNLLSWVRFEWLFETGSQAICRRNRYKVRQKSFAKWISQCRNRNTRKSQANDWEKMVKNRPHQIDNSGWSWWNDQWFSRSDEGHICWIIFWHSSLPNFSNHAQISFRNNWVVYEGTNKNITGEKISSCEGHKTVFHRNERWDSKVRNFNSALQKLVNWPMHTFCQH